MTPQAEIWLNKAEAAARLKLSVRSFQALIADGAAIERSLVRDDTTHQKVAVFKAADVDRVAKERAQPAQASERTALQSIAAPQGHGGHTIALLRALAGSSVPAAPILKPWLDLAEAAEYSGLPATWLLEHIRLGELPALDVGVRKGGRWRVARRDLDALQGNVQWNAAS